ncbi:hypothetical protein MKK84_14405 [Methylobacterium sp. E-065]|uniref:hypothetical protein n=1 Tax=Methylobacterium sp. E-065 TaxID=2836583 RepID=UPI001FBB55A8|nr:hypothetical protein [Methylobacterium sp. E-065]MCJ2018614.1 hypothetical protein [Methylobacterium sp. E-065]
MNKDIDRTVKALAEAQKALSKMTNEERMLVDEKLGSLLRQACVLQRFSLCNEQYRQGCDIRAGAFNMAIDASFGLNDDDADIPF